MALDVQLKIISSDVIRAQDEFTSPSKASMLKRSILNALNRHTKLLANQTSSPEQSLRQNEIPADLGHRVTRFLQYTYALRPRRWGPGVGVYTRRASGQNTARSPDVICN